MYNVIANRIQQKDVLCSNSSHGYTNLTLISAKVKSAQTASSTVHFFQENHPNGSSVLWKKIADTAITGYFLHCDSKKRKKINSDIMEQLSRLICLTSSSKIERSENVECFLPSRELIKLIKDRIEDINDIADEQSLYYFSEEEFANEISEEIDTLLADLSRRDLNPNTSVQISNEKFQLNLEIIDELVVRLGLNIYDLKPLMDRFFRELYNFAFHTQNMGWGVIYLEDDIICLKQKQDYY